MGKEEFPARFSIGQLSVREMGPALQPTQGWPEHQGEGQSGKQLTFIGPLSPEEKRVPGYGCQCPQTSVAPLRNSER